MMMMTTQHFFYVIHRSKEEEAWNEVTKDHASLIECCITFESRPLLPREGRLCIQIVKASGGRALFVTKGHKKLLVAGA